MLAPLANRRTAAIVARMDEQATPPPAASVEERLARLEKAGAPRASTLDRLLRFLPVIALGNIFLAAPAMLVSGAVAYFTFVQAEATEKMQVASVWPRVTYTNFNTSDGDNSRITLSLSNKGVGPAIIEGLQVRYQGRAYSEARALLNDCCGASGKTLALGISSLRGEVLRPGEEAMVTQLAARGTDPDVYARFNRERSKLEISTCYCSVFGDCWVDEGTVAGPRQAAQCPANWVQYIPFPQAGPNRR